MIEDIDIWRTAAGLQHEPLTHFKKCSSFGAYQ